MTLSTWFNRLLIRRSVRIWKKWVNICKKILITGTSGFIGFHLAQLLLEQEHWVVGIDAMTEYYDVELKKRRLKLLQQNNNFVQKEVRVEHNESLQHEVKEFSPDIIIHLAAQAGVRYSLKNPREYIDTNIVGTFNIIELAKELGIEHLLMASTSSVYGASQESPFKESIKTDRPLTIYAATKSSNEMMAHSYSHIYKIPTTMFRFFTVYGPWGRPDMALLSLLEIFWPERQLTFTTTVICIVILLM